jgi:ribonuclease HII|tara:strand:+ start:2348 stop:2968 length:621 start_codon:yes stop_codon:yes gene_type:complete
MLSRPQNLLEYERRFWGRGRLVAGVDEAGRGPLAGPVVAAALVLPEGIHIEGADDSKKLSGNTREALYKSITSSALSFSVGAASAREIDQTNILRATTVAMQRALEGLAIDEYEVVVDGLPVKGLGIEHDAVVGGDASIHSIGCASIIAKVTRDRLMIRLSERYPEYGWERNKGYGTSEHRNAIVRHGLTPHHRLTFGGLQYDLEL